VRAETFARIPKKVTGADQTSLQPTPMMRSRTNCIGSSYFRLRLPQLSLALDAREWRRSTRAGCVVRGWVVPYREQRHNDRTEKKQEHGHSTSSDLHEAEVSRRRSDSSAPNPGRVGRGFPCGYNCPGKTYMTKSIYPLQSQTF
jgi:hypothetical protein